MRLCALAVCLVLGIGVQDGWSLPVKSVFVTFPGDVIKNMSDVELAEVSSRWLFFVVTERRSQNCEQSSCCREVITCTEIPITTLMKRKICIFSEFKRQRGENTVFSVWIPVNNAVSYVVLPELPEELWLHGNAAPQWF